MCKRLYKKPIMAHLVNAYKKQSKPQVYSSLNTTTHQPCNPLTPLSFQGFVQFVIPFS